MAHNLYVTGFPYKTTKEELAKLFSPYGTVVSAKVILDRETGRPKGFGFVEMSTDAEAKLAVSKMNGVELGHRKIFVVEGRLDKNAPAKKAGSFKTPWKSSAAPSSSPPASPSTRPGPGEPGFIERRSGKDRRKSSAAADDRRTPPPSGQRAPAGEPPRFDKRPPFGKRPPFEKRPPSEKHSPSDKRPPSWKSSTPEKPFVRKPPVRGPVWRPKKD